MKMKRLTSLAIALLLVCGMPVSAFAMDNNQAGNTEPLVPADEIMDTNDGTVTTNDGTVTTNKGTVTTNNGTISTNNHTVTTNNGEVIINKGTVTTNENDGIIEINNGEVGTNNGTVSRNNAEVGTNNGTVSRNDAEVGTNNGTVDFNEGTVDINNGTVEINFGTVKTNEITGDVTNYDTGDGTNYDTGNVETNYGTVTYVKGNDNDEEITFYGVQVDGSLLQKEEGVELNLKEKFSKEGYELAGYIMNWRMDADRGLVSMETPKKTDDYIYSLDHPNVLTLIWMAISGSGDGSGDLDEDKGNGGNGSAAEGEKPEYFGPGCYISLNGKQYILTEIKGEDYYLASCDEYTQEELAEAGELLESLLTEEQLSHVTGEAGILEGELNELFFGGGSRIVFPCDIGMIFY